MTTTERQERVRYLWYRVRIMATAVTFLSNLKKSIALTD